MTTTEHNNKSKRITPTGRHKLKANEQHTAHRYIRFYLIFYFHFLVTVAAVIARTHQQTGEENKKVARKGRERAQQTVSEKKSQAVFLLQQFAIAIA